MLTQTPTRLAELTPLTRCEEGERLHADWMQKFYSGEWTVDQPHPYFVHKVNCAQCTAYDNSLRQNSEGGRVAFAHVIDGTVIMLDSWEDRFVRHGHTVFETLGDDEWLKLYGLFAWGERLDAPTCTCAHPNDDSAVPCSWCQSQAEEREMPH